MADRLSFLFQEWHQLGGAVLLAETDPNITPRCPEDVIAESTAYCRESGRLTWIVLDWLIHHISEIDETALLDKVKEWGDGDMRTEFAEHRLTVLGVLCDAACQRNPDPKFERLMRACRPHRAPEPFFRRVARSPLASRLARENNLEVFRRWNYYSNELRYLSR